jgi:hypothetical protein
MLRPINKLVPEAEMLRHINKLLPTSGNHVHAVHVVHQGNGAATKAYILLIGGAQNSLEVVVKIPCALLFGFPSS